MPFLLQPGTKPNPTRRLLDRLSLVLGLFLPCYCAFSFSDKELFQRNQHVSRRKEVRRVVTLYIDGAGNGNADQMNEAFHSSARWFGTPDGVDYDMDKEGFWETISFTNFFNLSILDGRWQITNKTFAATGGGHA
jgi:hypothetical protein